MASDTSRFWRTLIPFLAVGVGILVGCHLFAARTAPRFPDHQSRFARLVEEGSTFDALVVGNSLCCSMDWDALGLVGYELRHPGSDMYEAAYVIEEALPHLPNLRAVFIPLGFTALHWDNSLRGEMRSELYATYGAFRPIGGRWDGLVMGLFGPTVRPDNGEEVLHALLGRESDLLLDSWGRIDHQAMTAKHAWARLDSQAESAVERHLRIAGNVDASRPSAAEDVVAALGELARKLEERGVDLVLFAPPFHETYLRRFRETDRGKEIVKELRDSLRAFDAAHANARFIDASAHPQISRVGDNYRTCDHLSDAGAEAFSRLLKRALEPR